MTNNAKNIFYVYIKIMLSYVNNYQLHGITRLHNYIILLFE